jgi:hypothetical protein
MVTDHQGFALIDISTVKGKKITPKGRKRHRDNGHCMNWGELRHFTANCRPPLKVVSGLVQINPIKEDRGKGNDKEE